MALVAAGVILGLGTAAGLRRLMARQLFGVTATDLRILRQPCLSWSCLLFWRATSLLAGRCKSTRWSRSDTNVSPKQDSKSSHPVWISKSIRAKRIVRFSRKCKPAEARVSSQARTMRVAFTSAADFFARDFFSFFLASGVFTSYACRS